MTSTSAAGLSPPLELSDSLDDLPDLSVIHHQ
jgi:hypothetical protein